MANKIKLDEYRNKRKELRRNIEDYFTPEDPYYRDMLTMVANKKAMVQRHKDQLSKVGYAEMYWPDVVNKKRK